MNGFTKASEIPIGTSTRIEDLELLLTQQDQRIAELEEENESLRESDAPARPKRLSSDVLKDSERLILMMRINDLAIANEALEIELRKSVRNAEENIINLFSIVAKLKTEKPMSPGKTDTQRVQKLIRYMNARADHKASFETLRGYFQIKTNQLTALIRAADKLDPGRFTIKVDLHDKRKRWLMVKR